MVSKLFTICMKISEAATDQFDPTDIQEVACGRVGVDALCLSKMAKYLSGWGLHILRNPRSCPFFSRHSLRLCARSSNRVPRSSSRTWLCATKSLCFGDPRQNA
jgi:hypothetical protein